MSGQQPLGAPASPALSHISGGGASAFLASPAGGADDRSTISAGTVSSSAQPYPRPDTSRGGVPPTSSSLGARPRAYPMSGASTPAAPRAHLSHLATPSGSPSRFSAAAGTPMTALRGGGGGGGSSFMPPLHDAGAAVGKGGNADLLQLVFHTHVVLRGPNGVALTARPNEANPPAVGSTGPTTPTGVTSTPGASILMTPGAPAAAGGSATPMTPGPGGAAGGGTGSSAGWRVCPDGRGLGEPNESFLLMNCNRRDDKGPVSYGSTVALRCLWAKDRFLGVSSATGEAGFWRSLMGNAEKWTLARPDVIHAARSGIPHLSAPSRSGASSASVSSSTVAAPDAKGPVLTGDRVVLQSQATREVLCVRDSSDGPQIGLCAPEAALLSHATWEICWAGSPLYPSWNLSRPYLTGSFLLQPDRHLATEAQRAKFNQLPPASSAASVLNGGRDCAVPPAAAGTVAPLGQFSLAVQERLLVEDMLWAVGGYEARYIKVSRTATAADAGGGDPKALLSSLEDVAFVLDPAACEGVDASLASMARKFLPLGGYIVRIRRFIDVKRRYDYGMVAQALAAALAATLREYSMLLAQLEYQLMNTRAAAAATGVSVAPQKLTLQQLWFHLQPSLRSLKMLDALCAKVWRTKGGAMLNLIRAAATGGDDKSAGMYAYLLQRASAPYMSMLESWIYRGQLEDPYHEFMVREEQGVVKENVQRDFNANYWDSRSTIRPEHVFSVLEEHREQILTTGKYLNVIRECGQDVAQAAPAGAVMPELEYAAGKAALGEAVEAAYQRACGLLLDVLLGQHQLLPRLASIKHYFLLDKGDFFVHFMNSAEHELLKPVADISPSRIEALLHLSIHMSVASHDPYKDDVSSTFAAQKLIEQLTAIHKSDRYMSAAMPRTPEQDGGQAGHEEEAGAGAEGLLPGLPQMGHLSLAASDASAIKAYEAFTLDYQAKWPLSLVVSRRAVTKYQLLFRHLFLAKFVERRLHTAWAEQQSTKELDLRGPLGAAFCLRHKMQHFLENLIYYMMFEVIEPHWHALTESLRTRRGVEHVDDVIRLHQEFQDTCLKECLLTNQPLLRLLNKLIVVCLLFAAYMEQATRDFAEEAALASPSSSRPSGSGLDDDMGTAAGGGLFVGVEAGPAAAAAAAGGKAGKRGKGAATNAGAARRERVRAQTASVQLAAKRGAFARTMEAFAKNLDFHLKEFMRRLWEDSKAQYHSHLSNLLTRLDYNGYFTDSGDLQRY